MPWPNRVASTPPAGSAGRSSLPLDVSCRLRRLMAPNREPIQSPPQPPMPLCSACSSLLSLPDRMWRAISTRPVTTLRFQPGDQKIRSPKFHTRSVKPFTDANVVHALVPEQNQQLFRRVLEAAHHGARFLLVDLWTNATHTDPLFAALMAGEFLVVGGNGDVYSVEEARSWLEQAGWHFLEHKPLAGPASLLVAEVAA